MTAVYHQVRLTVVVYYRYLILTICTTIYYTIYYCTVVEVKLWMQQRNVYTSRRRDHDHHTHLMNFTLEFCTLVISSSSPRPSRPTCHKSPPSISTTPMLLRSLPETRVDDIRRLAPRSRVGRPRATKKAASILAKGTPAGPLLKATLMASLQQRLHANTDTASQGTRHKRKR